MGKALLQALEGCLNLNEINCLYCQRVHGEEERQKQAAEASSRVAVLIERERGWEWVSGWVVGHLEMITRDQTRNPTCSRAIARHWFLA